MSEALRIGPMYFWSRDSGGGRILVSWHRVALWRWFVSWQPYRGDERRRLIGLTAKRGFQSHYSLHVLRLGRLMLSTQDYDR